MPQNAGFDQSLYICLPFIQQFLDEFFMKKFRPLKKPCPGRLAAGGRGASSEVYLLVNLFFVRVICYLYSSVEKPIHSAIRHFSC